MELEPKMEKVGIKVKIISNAFDKTMNHVTADMELTSTQAFLLRYLTSNADKVIYQKDIEAQFNIKHPTITGILKRLSEKGFLECVTDEKDRRFKRVIVTQKSFDVQNESRRCMDETEASILSGLTPEEIAELHRLLNKVIANITPGK